MTKIYSEYIKEISSKQDESKFKKGDKVYLSEMLNYEADHIKDHDLKRLSKKDIVKDYCLDIPGKFLCDEIDYDEEAVNSEECNFLYRLINENEWRFFDGRNLFSTKKEADICTLNKALDSCYDSIRYYNDEIKNDQLNIDKIKKHKGKLEACK